MSLSTRRPIRNEPWSRQKAEWSALPKKKCDNCGKMFKPNRPEQRFCKAACKNEYHRHGGSFGKLKPVIEREIARQMRLEDRCPKCKGKGRLRDERRYVACHVCKERGKVLTSYGRQILSALLFYADDIRQAERPSYGGTAGGSISA